MEKRSRRRTRDLVTQAASQGLSENEIGCARISMMARSTNAPCKGRIQMRKTNTLQNSHLACNARPVHTVGSRVDGALARTFWRFAALVGCGHVSGLLVRQVWPLALMLCADRVPNKIAHFGRGALTQAGSPDPRNDRICITSSCPRQLVF